MPRTREFEPEAALDKAVHLFWQKGYGETSFDDIVSQTGVSRYGLYDAFGAKRDLFRQALQSYIGFLKRTHQQELRGKDASLPEIQAYFKTLLSDDLIVRRGCMICNTAFEVAPHDAEVAADVRGYFDEFTRVFRRALRNAKARRQLAPHVNPSESALSLSGLILSAALMDRVGFDAAKTRRQVAASLKALEAPAN